MPDGSNFSTLPGRSIQRDGQIPTQPTLISEKVSKRARKANAKTRASADGILVSMCQNAGLIADKANAALSGCAIRRDETAEQSADRLGRALTHVLREISETPATTAAGLKAKAALVVRFGDEDNIGLSIAKDLVGRAEVPPVRVPTLVAEPLASSDELFDRYNAWLYNERQLLMVERYGLEQAEEARRYVPCVAHDMHFPGGMNWTDVPKPMTRAAQMLATAGAFVGPAHTMSPPQVTAEAARMERLEKTGSAL